MTSILKVDAIQNTAGTSAVSIDSAGTGDFTVNNNITIFGLTAQSSITSTSLATITGLSKFDSQTNHAFKPIGSTVNESS